ESVYLRALLTALDQLHDATGRPPGEVAAASLFTTLSATAVLEKIRDQLAQATPEPADFLLGSNHERTAFPLADVHSISFRRQVTGPRRPVSFPRGSLMLDTKGLYVLSDTTGAVGTIAFGRYRSPDYETSAGVIPAVGTGTGTPAVH